MSIDLLSRFHKANTSVYSGTFSMVADLILISMRKVVAFYSSYSFVNEGQLSSLGDSGFWSFTNEGLNSMEDAHEYHY